MRSPQYGMDLPTSSTTVWLYSWLMTGRSLTDKLENAQRICIMLPTWVGDMIMATPAIDAIQTRYPQANWQLAGNAAAFDLFQAWPDVQVLLPVTKKPLSDARVMRASQPDAIILLPNSFRSALLARLAGVRTRVGYKRDQRSWLLTDGPTPPREHGRLKPVPAVDYYLELAAYCGADVARQGQAIARDKFRMTMPVTDEASEAARQIKADLCPEGQPLVLLCPGASKIEKRWPAQSFAALADHLTERCGVRVAVTGSPSEASILEQIISLAKSDVVNLRDHNLSLQLLLALCAQAQLMVCNDTGPRHIAAAAGCPVIALFGPTTPKWTLIPFEHDYHIQSQDGLINSIAIDSVAEKALSLLTRK